eukprot:COSAG01_NODE_5781_length_4035_cov_128.784553_1_plen_38_part_10
MTPPCETDPQATREESDFSPTSNLQGSYRAWMRMNCID